MSFPKCRSMSNMDLKAWSALHSVSEFDPSLTVQEQKEEADINNIVKAFGVTGRLPQGVRVPTYGDFTGADDYQSALEAIIEAEKAFSAMPSELRNRLDNDPQKFLEFCENSENLEELRKYGLAPPAEPAPQAKPDA